MTEKSLPGVRVYRYGLLAPTTNALQVREQIRVAHAYRNTMTEIERGRRTAMRDLYGKYGDVASLEEAVAQAEREVTTALAAVKAHKGANRTSKVPPEMRRVLDDSRIKKRDSLALLRDARRRVKEDPQTQARADEINATATELSKNAYQYSGCFWGQRQLVDDAMNLVRRMPLYDGPDPNDPRFARWTGEGSVNHQIIRGKDGDTGMPVADVEGDDTRLRIERVPDRFNRPGRGWAVLHLRVGSVGRDPVFASWPMVMHRDMPLGARVKRAQVHVRKIGPREEWYVTLVVEGVFKRPEHPRAAAVAVDLGWRSFPDGTIRVGTWAGTDGECGEIRLSARDVSGLHKAEELRSTRDRIFNEARTALVAWIAGAANAPTWFSEETETVAQWRSQARMARFVAKWREHRFDGDREAYDAMERWRCSDHHLWKWESDQRVGALRNRREVYRVAAKRLADRYDQLVVEKFDLRVFAERPKADEGSVNETARANRQLVSPSECRACLVNAFHGDVAEKSAVDTTRQCHGCQSVEHFDQANQLTHACKSCGREWDQDDNAAINLLARWAQDGSTAEVEDSEGRWDRVKRRRGERESRSSVEA